MRTDAKISWNPRLAKHGRPMAPEDAARLHMSMRGNPMIIGAALLLDAPLERAQVEERLRERLTRYRRFTERVVEAPYGIGRPRWLPLRDFDVRSHLTATTSSCSPAELLSESLAAPLDPGRPLWSMRLVDRPGDASVLVLAVHHCVADGAGLVKILTALADDAPALRDEEPEHRRESPKTKPCRIVRDLAAGAFSTLRLVMQPGDRSSPIHGPVTGRKLVASSSRLSMRALTDASHVLGVTVNDLLLAAVSGAIRALFRRRGREAPNADARAHALVPVALRNASNGASNRFASVFVPLPLDVDDASERARTVDREVRELRARSLSSATRLVGAAGLALPAVERVGVALLSRKGSVMVSNVHGPDATLRFCGARVEDVIVCAPAPGSIGVAVSLFSYDGRASITVAVDAGIGVAPERLVADLETELALLVGPTAGELRV